MKYLIFLHNRELQPVPEKETDMHLERFVEALSDPSSNLTYYALSGARKQSVQDAERLLSPEVAEFMEKEGYTTEAAYVRAITNWRRSCDQRGLSELQRCRFNYQLLNYILDDLMPWHTQIYDFSLLEVNRFSHT
jgi:gamma-glutamylcysteine synthetase